MTKIFCIGFNKTGTTSLQKAFADLGYSVNNQDVAERLLPDVASGNFQNIIDYCESAEFFQDVPFSLPKVYLELDKAFPESKFILSIRNDADQWYHSLTTSHSRIFGNGKVPTCEDLR